MKKLLLLSCLFSFIYAQEPAATKQFQGNIVHVTRIQSSLRCNSCINQATYNIQTPTQSWKSCYLHLIEFVQGLSGKIEVSIENS